MEYRIKKATIDDFDGISSIIQDVYGSNDFISHQIKDWINNTSLNYPIVALDNKNYIGFANNRILGDYLWIEGLRVSPNYRKMNVGTELIKHSITYCLNNNKNVIGFATGNGNTAMHKIAGKLGFDLIGKQVVINNRAPNNKRDLSSSYKPITDKRKFYDLVKNKYNNQIYTAFFKIPNNIQGKDLLDTIPIYETKNYYFLHEIEHGEATQTRGIFTIFLKDILDSEQFIEELVILEDYARPYHYKRLTISITKNDIIRELIFDQILIKKNYDKHILHFFEKKQSNGSN